ncbi:P-loop NTPase family protein [Ornithinibacillus halophilus]|uniref:Adenylate kinase n=1 Tax=Ornithinibacillus halophilus TaxID=930117 RepID=A0A1M5LYE3_9BACI|nr:AAA family ATPase [Ornithinibacillus halophilus]SHG70026.1 Adenylate kinase [Ornithinibacillus halophilus]
MKKIAIIGNPGSGKSTLAKHLGSRLNLPVYHMDQLFWNPGWNSVDKDTLLKKHDEILLEKEWIIEGNYGVTLEQRLREADTIIFLHYSTLRSLYGITRRRIQYHNKTRPDMTEGCPERLNWEFFQYTRKFNKEKVPNLYSHLKPYINEKTYIFHSRGQLNQYLKTIRKPNNFIEKI